MPISSGLPYDELLYHMDLCILSYALYSQSLVWPFDPYYEWMAVGGSSRRVNTMTAVRNWATAGPAAARVQYHGPGSAQGWPINNEHDPIMFRYDGVHPWLPAIVAPEKKWILYNLPAELLNRIGSVRVCQYAGAPDPNLLAGTPTLGAAVARPAPPAGAADVVYCFEGGTGGKPGTPASWSLMGLILERIKGAGPAYDVHIAFRGSRSGSGGRAMTKGAFQGTGNPDWVTDMDFGSMVQDPVFGTHGSVSRGFSHSVKTCMPNIIACLSAIQANHAGVIPDNIWVTGHSLGGALATHFTAAMVVGNTYGPNGQGPSTPAPLRAWHWDRTKLISVSAPKCAGKSFHRNFNGKVFCRRVVLSSDPITKDPPRITAGRHAFTRLDLHHVGTEVYVTQETTVGHTLNPLTFGDHEPKAIRARLIRKLVQWGDVAAPLGPGAYTLDPWNNCPKFNDVGLNPAMSNPTMHALLANVGATDADHYLSIIGPVLGTSAAYRTFIRDATGLARVGALAHARTRIGISAGRASAIALNEMERTLNQLRAHYPDDMVEYFGLVLILAEMGRNPAMTRTLIRGNDTLKASL